MLAPEGASSSLTTESRPFRRQKMVNIIVDSKCTGCETCVNICPASVYEMINGKSVPVRAKDCILCRTCEAQCPDWDPIVTYFVFD